MQTVTAYMHERSGRLFADERLARREEFEWLLKDIAGHLPEFNERSMPRSPEMFFEWLAEQLLSGVYQPAFPALNQAVAYFAEYRDVIEGRSKKSAADRDE